MALLKRLFRLCDNYLEPFFMVVAYTGFTLIIAVEVVRRFVFQQQTTWGAEVAIHLFIWLTWIAASWGVKKRTHLSFPGIRESLPKGVQLGLHLMDSALWLLLGGVVLYGAQKMIEMQYMFGSVIQGSTIPLWWSFSIVPIGWALIYLRVLQNSLAVINAYRRGESLSASRELRETLPPDSAKAHGGELSQQPRHGLATQVSNETSLR